MGTVLLSDKVSSVRQVSSTSKLLGGLLSFCMKLKFLVMGLNLNCKIWRFTLLYYSGFWFYLKLTTTQPGEAADAGAKFTLTGN